MDEVWWSRLQNPSLSSWAVEHPLRLENKKLPKEDKDKKAISCYGLLCKSINKVWLRFVEVRPVSCITISYLQWVVRQLEIEKKKVLLLIWDNATWHKSKQVRSWIKEHNKEVKSKGGLRILKCFLPIKSPWLNPIEPRWVHAKRSIVEPTGILSSSDLISRVCSYFNNPILDLLKQDLL